jgi:hypothetical protein
VRGQAYARRVLPLLKYVGAAIVSCIVLDMIKAGKCNGLVLGFIDEIAVQLKNARSNLLVAAVATAPRGRRIPAAHRKADAEIRKAWRNGRSKIMLAMADAL